MTRNEQAWMEMTLATLRHNQPHHYVEDFIVHDRTQLGQYRIPEPRSEWELPEGSPFGWILRDCGTHIICPIDHRIGMARHCYDMVRIYGNGYLSTDNIHWFVWTGEELIECTFAHLKRWVYFNLRPEPVEGESCVVAGAGGGQW